MRLLCILAFAAACAAQPVAPYADYHVHLLSPATAKLAGEPPLPAVALPAELKGIVGAMECGWNDKAALASLFTEDAVVMNQRDTDQPTWVRGRDAVATFLSMLFAREYRITPVSVSVDGNAAQLAGYYTRGEKHFGHVFLALRKASDGAWRIAGATPSFPGPTTRDPMTAAGLIAQLDDAGIRKGVVLSVAYWYGSAWRPPFENEYEKVRAENDWVAAETAKFPERLVAFCGMNPLKDYAVDEVVRCAKMPSVKGIKLHFGNAKVNLRDEAQRERVRRVFRAANEHRLAIVAHLWTGPDYEKNGAEDARLFLEHVLPLAADVPVQVAHLAGGGHSTDPALAVFAEAIAAKDPRTARLYFDVATTTDEQTAERLKKDAERMRQIGFDRILYGTDSAPPSPPARQSWQRFRVEMPLTDDEVRAIAGNRLPYLN